MPGDSFGWQRDEGSRYGTATYTFPGMEDKFSILKTKAAKLGLRSTIQHGDKGTVVVCIDNIDIATATTLYSD